jgi:hypothetical protein
LQVIWLGLQVCVSAHAMCSGQQAEAYGAGLLWVDSVGDSSLTTNANIRHHCKREQNMKVASGTQPTCCSAHICPSHPSKFSPPQSPKNDVGFQFGTTKQHSQRVHKKKSPKNVVKAPIQSYEGLQHTERWPCPVERPVVVMKHMQPNVHIHSDPRRT